MFLVRVPLSLVLVPGALVLVHGGEVYDATPSQAVSGATYLLHAPTLRWAQPPALFLSNAATPAAAAAPAPALAGAVPPHDSLASRLVAPPRRSGHTAVVIGGDGDVGGHVLLYGGHGADSNRAVSNDVWLLEL